MIPVAGRRRGQATSFAPAAATDNASSPSGGEPNWLFGSDDDNNNTNNNNNNNSNRRNMTSASTSATTRIPPTVPSAQDALSFLDFDDDPTVTATTTTTGPPPSASTFLTPSSVPVAGVLGGRGRETGTVQTPSFLVSEFAVTDVIPSSSSQLTSLSSPSLKNRWEELQRESQIIQGELLESEKCIKLLESNEDELCKEVKALEEEVRVKKEKEKEGEVLLMSTKETLEEKRRQLQEERDGRQKHEMDEQLKLLKTQYESEIINIETFIKEHETLLLDLEEKHATMSKTISMTDFFEDTLQKMEDKVGKGIHSMGTSMCIRVKPILIDSIRDTVADSSQQRLDILSNDRQKRREELNNYHERRIKNMNEFRQERREKHKIRLDSIFGDSISQSRFALETRLAKSRQLFLEQQKSATLESQRYIQHAIDEMVRRSEEELIILEKKFHEELKRTESQYTAELEHHARLYTAEREAGIRSQRETEEDNKMKTTTPSIYKSAEKRINFLRERIEQLRHSVIFDIQELSSSLPRYGNNNNNTHGIREKEVILKEFEQRISQLSHQLQIKWEQFRSAISPLEQCVNSMSDALQEGRVKSATMLQGIECVYRAWNQDIRRELSNCFTSNAASSSSDSIELESTTACMTHVLNDILNRLQDLMTTHKSVYVEQKKIGYDVSQQVSELTTHRQDSDVVLQSVLESCNNLTRLTAEVEVRQSTLSVEEEEHKAAKQQLEKERAEFNERLKNVQNLSTKLRRETAQLEKNIIPRGYTEENTRVLCDMTSESIHSDNTTSNLMKGKGIQQEQELRKSLIIGETTIPYIGDSTTENDTGVYSRNESSTGFVSLLTVEDASPMRLVTEGTDETDERPQSYSSSYALSSYRMGGAIESRSLTTPSTSNS